MYHSSEIRGLRSTYCSRETLQNLPYFCNKNVYFYLMNVLPLVYVNIDQAYIKLGFSRGGALTAIFRGGAGYFLGGGLTAIFRGVLGGRCLFFSFDEVKMKHFVFFREF